MSLLFFRQEICSRLHPSFYPSLTSCVLTAFQPCDIHLGSLIAAIYNSSHTIRRTEVRRAMANGLHRSGAGPLLALFLLLVALIAATASSVAASEGSLNQNAGSWTRAPTW